MDPAAQYTDVAVAASAVVIARYSSSFALASRLLPQRVRPQVTSIYGLVRVADEIVDGACPNDPGAHLDALAAETEQAIVDGFSANPVVHAFAHTARETGFGTELTAPFFASMRRDLDPSPHTSQSLNEYIYGSAEVVGLMCLRGFLHGMAPAGYAALAPSARRLGSAFQKINFLRDLTDDERRLGRGYLPDLTTESFDVALADARADLVAGRGGIGDLPADVRRGVRAAADLYAALTDRLESAGLDGVRAGRVRVPAAAKLLAVLRGARSTI